MRKKAVVVLLFLGLISTMACNQQFWFRKKVNKENADSTEVEKSYQIIW